MQQVNNRGDLLVVVDHGSDDGSDHLTELRLDGLQAGGIIAVVFFRAVDKDHAGLLTQHLPGTLHTDGQAVLGVTHDYGAFGGADSGQRFAGEVKVTGGIHHVDLHALVVDRCKCQRNRDLALDFFCVVVTGGVAVGRFAETIRALGHKEHLLCQRGLTGAAVAQQRDITNIISGHNSEFSLHLIKRVFEKTRKSLNMLIISYFS